MECGEYEGIFEGLKGLALLNSPLRADRLKSFGFEGFRV